MPNWQKWFHRRRDPDGQLKEAIDAAKEAAAHVEQARRETEQVRRQLEALARQREFIGQSLLPERDLKE